MQLQWRLTVARVDSSKAAARCINRAGLCSVARLRHGPRIAIIAHGRRGRSRDASTSAPATGDRVPVSRDQLLSWTKPELMEECRQRGLTVGGNKAALVQRLADSLWGPDGDGASAVQEAAEASTGAVDAKQDAQRDEPEDQQEQQQEDAAAQQQEDGQDEQQRLLDIAEDRAVEALWVETRAVLATWPYAKLVSSLQERGLSASGSADTLLDRLSDAMVLEAPPEEFETLVQEQLSALDPNAAAAPARSAPAAADTTTSSSAPAGPSGRAVVRMDPEEREYLVADKQQKLLEDLGQVDSAELAGVLQEAGEELSGSESRDELLERVSWMLAEEEVTLMEENAAAGQATADTPAAEAEAEPAHVSADVASTSQWRERNLPSGGTSAGAGDPNSILSTLNVRLVNSMKVSDLRATLAALGLSDQGARYDLRDRLQTILAVHHAAMSGSMEDTVKQLSGMTIKELRSELDRRGLPTHGTKGNLEARLGKAMTLDLSGQPVEEVVDEANTIQAYDAAHETPSTDPPLTLAVVVGGALSIERETSLASARTLIDAIHTAAMAAPELAGSSAAAGKAAAKGEAAADDGAHGVEVDVYMMARDGAIYSVPSAHVLSLSLVDLDAQLPALCRTRLQSANDLASHLKSSERPTVALSLLPQGHSSAAQLASALEAQGVASAGASAQVLESVADRGQCLAKVQSLGYPVLPMHRIDAQEWDRATSAAQAAATADDAAAGASAGADEAAEQQQQQQQQQEAEDGPLSGAAAVIAGQLAQWCEQQGWDPELQLLAVAAAESPTGEGSTFAKGARRAAQRVEEFMAGGQHQSVLVEPYAGASLLAWNVVVMETEDDGPVALMPTQIELYDAELEMFKHKLDVAEHELMQDGTPPEEIVAQMTAMAAVEPDSDYAGFTSLPRPLAHRTVKFKSPPEMSLAMTQALRHAAAKAFSELGLRGVARVSGWVALDPDWRQKYKRADEFVEPLADLDVGIMNKVAQQMDADAALLPLPLSDYYNQSIHMADLSAFDVRKRLDGEANGEGTVYVAGVEADTPLHVGSIAQQEAAEVGLSPGALARHLANVALHRAGLDVQLPLQRPADMNASVLWAHVSGATKAEEREVVDVNDEEQRAPDPFSTGKMEPVIHLPGITLEELRMDLSRPFDELAREIVEITAPVPWDMEDQPPPEDWEPEFDPRTQDEINAERDATLPPERLAWRQGEETWFALDRFGGDMEIAKEIAAGRLSPNYLAEAAAAREGQAAGSAVALQEEDEDEDEQHPSQQRPRVWVLMGGEGDERQESLRSGINVWAKLQRFPDLLVEPFLLPPVGAGADETARRAALLERRTTWLCNSLPEEDLPKELQLENIRNMTPPVIPFLRQLVWALPPSSLARHSVEEVVESAERMVARSSLSYLAMPAELKQQMDVQLEVQAELAAHFVQGVGGTWGGRSDVLPVPPRVMDLASFVDEAAACGATVFLAMHNSSHVLGPLQEVLTGCKVAYTGAGQQAAMVCGSKVALAEALAALEESGISCPPRRVIDTAQLLECTDWAADAELLWEQLTAEWDEEGSAVDALVLKPVEGGSGIGVAKICNSKDLALYAAALQQGATAIPPGMLSGHSRTLYMPPVAPAEVVVEPWVDTDPVTLTGTQGAAGSSSALGAVSVDWSGDSRWVEAVVGLIGDLGAMQAMAPSLVAQSPSGERCHVTPAPPSVLSPEAVAGAQERAVLLAARLGLRGLAQVDCFVNADTGELIVLDVRPSPKLLDGHPLLQQALLQSPPLLPHELFREQLLLAQQAHESDMAAAKSSLGTHSAWYEDDGMGGDDLEDPAAGDFDLAPPQLVGAGAEDEFAL